MDDDEPQPEFVGPPDPPWNQPSWATWWAWFSEEWRERYRIAGVDDGSEGIGEGEGW